MALTPSTMLELGTKAPDFRLPDPHGRIVARDDFADAPGLLVAFICNHCPYVKHLKEGLARFARDYQGKGLAMVAISANDVSTHPDDAPEKMAEDAQRFGYVFPYLHDESQEVAKAYRAACTPEFYLFDAERRLVYRGQFDASRPGNDVPVTGRDLRRRRRAAGGAPRPGGAGARHRLQHQVEAGRPAGLRVDSSSAFSRITRRISSSEKSFSS